MSAAWLVALATTLMPAQKPEDLREVRVLVLDVSVREASDGVEPSDLKLIDDTVLNAFRGNPALLIARNDRVRIDNPLVADRLAGCEEELCLYEAGESVTAEFVVFSVVERGAQGFKVHLGAFETKVGEIVVDENVTGESAASMVPSLEGAAARILEPIAAGTKPNLFEQPTFLTGAGLVFLGTMLTFGGLGWAAEMEFALADPPRHRDQKQFALDNGHRALWIAGFGVMVVAAGGLVLGWELSE